MKPLISVIIPVFNSRNYLQKCLDSIINQSYNNLEIILVDDGSTDGSSEICEKYANNDHRIIFCKQKNQGVSSARNRGINLMRGDYVHFPDSDDYLELDAYNYLIDIVQKNDYDIINFQHYTTYSNYEIPSLLPSKYIGTFNSYQSHIIIEKKVLFVWNKFFKSSLIGDTRFREDVLFGHFIIEKAKTVYFDNRLLYHYVQSESSAVRGSFKVTQLSAVKLYDAYYPLWPVKYPQMMKYFLPNMANLLILLYFDMWNDELDYQNKQDEVFSCYSTHFIPTLKQKGLSIKQILKFSFFRVAPTIFCKLHKIIHRL